MADRQFREFRKQTVKMSSSSRDIAAVTGVGHSTVHRFANGKDITLSVARKLLPALRKCPCCGRTNDA